MSVKIKLTRNAGGNQAGDTITTTPKAAEHLIDAGYAEEVKGRAKKAEDTTD
ncbi:hypothetical protein [Microbacterium sp. UCD-TDU]|uniref:hypothetical protein n=1 Tax=Microbacterium sp. UCD-TDU TaxID=1247714 RepID=UPI000349A578|nr:hypothetical protein [Microbacterium sp. UCD-TDU]